MHKQSSLRARYKNFTRQEKILLPIFHAILLIFAIWMMLPIFFALLNSLKTVDEYYVNSMAFPTSFALNESFRISAIGETA